MSFGHATFAEVPFSATVGVAVVVPPPEPPPEKPVGGGGIAVGGGRGFPSPFPDPFSEQLLVNRKFDVDIATASLMWVMMQAERIDVDDG